MHCRIYKFFTACYVVFNCLITSVSWSQSAATAKNLFFYQLNTEHGLSDNLVTSLCTDKNSNLWIGTNEGLNRFNGKTVTRFLKDGYPRLASNNILGLVCDNNNRIWARRDEGFVTLIDENRKFYKVSLYDNNAPLPVKKILKTNGYGAILFTEKGFLTLATNKKLNEQDSLTLSHFSFISVAGADSIWAKSSIQAEPFDEDSYVFGHKGNYTIINFKEKRVTKTFQCAGTTPLLHWMPGEMLLYDSETKGVKSINVNTGQISFPFNGITDQFGRPLAPRMVDAEMMDKDNLLLATVRDGLYLYNIPEKKLTQYLHRAGDATTLSNNRPTIISKSNDGWIFIGSRYNGVCYFKNGAVIGQQIFFADKTGSSYDGYINSILQKNNDEYYIGTSSSLLRWNRATNNTIFVDYEEINGNRVVNEDGTSLLSFDKPGRLWFITSTKGLVVMDKNERMIKRFPFDTINKKGLMATWAEHIISGPDGQMWIGTNNGLRRINPVSLEVDDLSNTPFHRLRGSTVIDIFFNNPGYIWIGTTEKGLWKYNVATKEIQQFTTKEGLLHNHLYCINKDNAGNIYIGTEKGVQIFLTDGRTKTITTKDGLVNSRVNILMPDAKGRMWMSNITGIACYNPADSGLKYFDQSYGLGMEDIRKWAYYRAADDELFWGTEKGIQYFYPDALYNYKKVLKAAISRVESENLKEDITESRSFRLHTGDNNITFHFSTIEYLAQLRTFYQYKLEGQDKDWTQVINQNAVRYNSLAPGNYVFKVRASSDNRNWVAAENEISFYIPPPFYKTWWFRVLAILTAAGSVYNFVRRREKRIKKKEIEKTEIEKLKTVSYKYQLEIEQVVNYFATSISAQNTVDDLLWDVSKNLIGKLGFEDCMIYLWNDDKTLLLQKAGYGIKGAMQIEADKNKYHVPRGKGIVGAAAGSKQSILVNDTSKDARYFTADDTIRLSELCVPMLHNNETLGVINTEHPEKNFYTQQHLQILNAIAAHCADKIDKINAEEKTRSKELEVLKLNKDLATSQLTALRAQMNPHFIFNALNSVQQYILQGNVTEANKYLSKFSKLQREILNYSSQNFIPLQKEIETLLLYLELEQLRFAENFTFTIVKDEQIDEEEIKIPPMIIQPFIENAIWHGLMPKTGDRFVKINFSLQSDEELICTITDNGIGREAASRLRQSAGNETQHKSKGMSLVYDRLNILQAQYGKPFTASITDLVNEEGIATGTQVELTIYLDF